MTTYWYKNKRGRVMHAAAGDWIRSGQAMCGADIRRPTHTTARVPQPTKSVGHVLWLAKGHEAIEHEGQIYIAHVSTPINSQGYRHGRWECSRDHWDRYNRPWPNEIDETTELREPDPKRWYSIRVDRGHPFSFELSNCGTCDAFWYELRLKRRVNPGEDPWVLWRLHSRASEGHRVQTFPTVAAADAYIEKAGDACPH